MNEFYKRIIDFREVTQNSVAQTMNEKVGNKLDTKDLEEVIFVAQSEVARSWAIMLESLENLEKSKAKKTKTTTARKKK